MSKSSFKLHGMLGASAIAIALLSPFATLSSARADESFSPSPVAHYQFAKQIYRDFKDEPCRTISIPLAIEQLQTELNWFNAYIGQVLSILGGSPYKQVNDQVVNDKLAELQDQLDNLQQEREVIGKWLQILRAKPKCFEFPPTSYTGGPTPVPDTPHVVAPDPRPLELPPVEPLEPLEGYRGTPNDPGGIFHPAETEPESHAKTDDPKSERHATDDPRPETLVAQPTPSSIGTTSRGPAPTRKVELEPKSKPVSHGVLNPGRPMTREALREPSSLGPGGEHGLTRDVGDALREGAFHAHMPSSPMSEGGIRPHLDGGMRTGGMMGHFGGLAGLAMGGGLF